MKRKFGVFSAVFLLLFLYVSSFLSAQAPAVKATAQEKFLQSFYSISSHKLLAYVQQLASEKYGGRLTGTEQFKACVRWVASLLKEWGIAPAGDDNSYLQSFPNPYTLVFKGCQVYLNLPYKGEVIK
ncbi:MAG: hypothetical protein ACE5GI_07875, partial [Candidatus Aminicenantales bacterium]